MTAETSETEWQSILADAEKIARIETPYNTHKGGTETLARVLVLDVLGYLESMAMQRGKKQNDR